MGPLIHAEARSRVQALVEEALAGGAERVTPEQTPEPMPRGFFFPPTILKNVTPAMRIVREEIFGPVVSLLSFTDEESGIGQANDTEAGLVAYVYTGDAGRIARLSERLAFGEVQVNGFKYAIYLPHGGIKESGMGHDGSHYALEDYLVHKRITVKQ